MIKSIDDLELKDKRVFLRVDFNVPLNADGSISDDTRINAAIPTIRKLSESGAKVVLASHLGRPNGERDSSMSLAPVAPALAERIGLPVLFLNDCIGNDIEDTVNSMTSGQIALLENLRFYPGETDNDPAFAQSLSNLADIYINDAFGTAHRAHASTCGVAELISDCAAGYLIQKELEFLGEKTESPDRPFIVILGGAKVSDKITVIDRLLDKADTIIIGGGMAYTFALARGHTVGDSLCEPDKVELALRALKKAEEKGVKFMLPVDYLVTNSLDFKNKTLGDTQVVEGNIPDGWEGVDAGPKTTALYTKEVAKAKTVLWNGPMGVFEIEGSSKGTFAVAKAVADGNALSIIGGGDSVKAIKMSGYSDKVSFMSTGGGASLEFLEGKELPGVAVLDQ